MHIKNNLEGIDVFAIGYGPVIMKEYLYIICQGKESNVYQAANANALYTLSHTIQKSVSK